MKNKVLYNSYMNSYMKRRWKKRRRKAIQYLGGCCVKCGRTKKLQFDHIDPRTKTCTIARASSFSQKRFLKEVNKCQLLCKKHHKIKTFRERNLHNVARGERIKKAAFTDNQVIKLRKLFNSGRVTAIRIQRHFGVTRTTVRHMLNGVTYSHV
jgi:5-methylcytosine-specific restriction endonuclease McrA